MEYFSWQIKGILWSLEYLHHFILSFSFIIFIGAIHWVKKTNKFGVIIRLNWLVNTLALLLFFVRLLLYLKFKLILEKYDAGVSIISIGTGLPLLYGVFWLMVVNPIFRKLSTRATT